MSGGPMLVERRHRQLRSVDALFCSRNPSQFFENDVSKYHTFFRESGRRGAVMATGRGMRDPEAGGRGAGAEPMGRWEPGGRGAVIAAGRGMREPAAAGRGTGAARFTNLAFRFAIEGGGGGGGR